MCFSSTASFTAAAALVPMGVLAVRRVHRQGQPERLPLAVTPWLFALQQFSEGVVWADPTPGVTRAAALLYLLFAYALWPAWMPWLALRFGASRLGSGRRRLLQLLHPLGILFGLTLWLPLALDPRGLQLREVGGSLQYGTTFLAGGLVSHSQGSGLYLLLVGLPLLLVPSWRLRLFALLVLLSFGVAQIAYLYAFTSVWCYFAALLSGLALWVIAEPKPPGRTAPESDSEPAAA